MNVMLNSLPIPEIVQVAPILFCVRRHTRQGTTPSLMIQIERYMAVRHNKYLYLTFQLVGFSRIFCIQ